MLQHLKIEITSIMKSIILISFMTIMVILNSCEKKAEYPFEAEVLGRNSDCGLYAIKFKTNLQMLHDIADSYILDETYIAKNLPENLQVDGLIIVLNIRKIQNSELTACTDRGPTFPWIYILNAKIKD